MLSNNVICDLQQPDQVCSVFVCEGVAALTECLRLLVRKTV